MAARDPFGTALHRSTSRCAAGEIVGVAGVSGNGQKELLAALSGESIAPHAGFHHSVRPARRRPRRRRRAALWAWIRARGASRPRRRAGACPSPTIRCSPARTRAWCGMASSSALRRAPLRARPSPPSRSNAAASSPRPSGSPAATCRNSSSAARSGSRRRSCWSAQPTWGVDVGAAQLIHQALIDLRDSGVGRSGHFRGTRRAVRHLRSNRRAGARAACPRRIPARSSPSRRSALLMTGAANVMSGAGRVCECLSCRGVHFNGGSKTRLTVGGDAHRRSADRGGRHARHQLSDLRLSRQGSAECARRVLHRSL